jgi:hypothetical protein
MILVKSQHNLTQNHIAKELSCSNTELVCIGEMMYDGVGDQIRIELSDLDDKLWVRYEDMDNVETLIEQILSWED